MKFRSEINGLRAIAVVPVLLFHSGVPFFSGGFLGVDVFFVISGYLITEKLSTSLTTRTFSFLGFYDNRVRRLLPALLVVCACATVCALILMLPYSLKNYGQSLFATMLSANNVLLYFTSGYWSLAAEFKPKFYALMLLGLCTFLAIGFALHRTYGLQALWPTFAYGQSAQTYVDEPNKLKGRAFRNDGKIRVLVVGNSFARDYINMLREGGYLGSLDIVYTDGDCIDKSPDTFDSLLGDSDLVVFSNNWAQTASDDAIPQAYSCYRYMRQKAAGRVVVLGVKNFGWNNDFVRTVRGPYAAVRVPPLASVVEFNRSASALFGPDYINVLALITDENNRVPVFTPGDELITYDTNHLTKAGARFLGGKIFAAYPLLIGKQQAR